MKGRYARIQRVRIERRLDITALWEFTTKRFYQYYEQPKLANLEH